MNAKFKAQLRYTYSDLSALYAFEGERNTHPFYIIPPRRDAGKAKGTG